MPRHLLRRFTNADGRLTVAHLREEPLVLRNQHPRRVGAYPGLNTWEAEDGAHDERLELGPLNRLDTVGAEAIRRVAEFATEARADEHLRLITWPWEERVGLYLTIAGLMVRSPAFRRELDEQALPTLLDEMRARLAAEEAAGTADGEIVAMLRATLDRPGAVALDPGRNRHQTVLIPLIQTVALALGLRLLPAVRRLPAPALHTGSEPVVVYPTRRLDEGRSCARLLTEAEQPVRMWEQHHDMLAAVDALVSGIAGLAFAIDPRTLVVLFDADTENGCGLMFMTSQMSAGGVAGMVNLGVTAHSEWIAGSDDCELLRVTTQAIERAN